MTVLVSDSFNRANSTTGLGTTDSYNGGTATTWQAITGTLGISSNQAYIVTTATNDNVAVADSGQSDVTITVTDVSDSSKIGSIYARVVDSNNWIRLAKVNTGSGALYLQTKLNGTVTTIATATSLTMGSNDVLKLTLQGNSITAYLNGTSVITATNSNNQTATKHGIGTQGSGSVTFDNFEVDSLVTGTNVSINATIANATASDLAPSISTQSQISISSVVANSNASAFAPTVSTGTGTNIPSVIANANANAPNPAISLDNNIQSVIGSATASALSPQVGSFTNVSINAVVANSISSANNPSVATTQNINLGAPIAGASASAIVPANVGVSTSAIIAATIASLMVDVIAPSVSTTTGVNIQTASANVSANGLAPTLQRDMVVFAVVGGSRASALAPLINWTSTDIIGTIYIQGSRILNVNLTGNQVLDINLKGVVS